MAKYLVECWQCSGIGQLPGCFEDCCSGADCDPDDAEYCCNPRRCDICRGNGSYVVSELTEDNHDRAVRVEN